MPGQRGGRVVLGDPQARARPPLPVRHPRPMPGRAIIAWINRYNAVRLHSSLGNVPPIEWELRYRHTATAGRITMCPADGGKVTELGPGDRAFEVNGLFGNERGVAIAIASTWCSNGSNGAPPIR